MAAQRRWKADEEEIMGGQGEVVEEDYLRVCRKGTDWERSLQRETDTRSEVGSSLGN